MAITLLVVASQNGAATSLMKALRQHHIEATHVATQEAARMAIERQQPDFLLLPQYATRLATRPFVERVRTLSPTAGLIGIGEASWPLAPLLDEVTPAPAQVVDILRLMPPAKQKRDASTLILYPLKLEIATRRLSVGTREYQMRPKEALLLATLMRRCHALVTRTELMWEVWETTFVDDTRTLDVHIRWLREKIEEDPGKPRMLTTVRGKGYCLRAGV